MPAKEILGKAHMKGCSRCASVMIQTILVESVPAVNLGADASEVHGVAPVLFLVILLFC